MDINIVSKISSFALDVINSTGYSGIFILSFLESAAIPVPSEVVVPFSGFLAASGRFSLISVVLIATLANFTGSVVLYLVGKGGGRYLIEKFGKYVLISRHDLEMGDKWFSKYGSAAVFWGRVMPVVRTFISLPAGIAKMNFGRFCLYTFLGALPWNAALAYVGYKTGENWNYLHGYFRKFDIIILLAVIGLLVFFIFKKLKSK